MQTSLNWNIQYWPYAAAQYEIERDLKPEWLETFSFTTFPSRMIERWLSELEFARRVLVPSELVKKSLTEVGVTAERIDVIPYGVDPVRYRPLEQRSDEFSVVCVGEIGQRKGIAYLFDVAHLLPHVRFLVVGWHVTPLPMSPPANVHIFANVPDVVPYLQGGHLFLFPSLVDGFGLVVLQALACGLPVVCSPHAGAAEIIAEGRDGFVIDPREPAQIASAIIALQENRERWFEMSQAARDKALAFPWERFHAGVAASLFGSKERGR